MQEDRAASPPPAPALAAPATTPLKNRIGPVDRRGIAAALGGGFLGTLLGLRGAEAQGLRDFLPFLPGSGRAQGAPPANHATLDVSGVSFPTLSAPSGRLANLGDYLWLTPTKLGGAAHLQDLGTGRTLAWIAYWNYGDTCPISHHLAAFPSPDPRKGFEFVNSTQGAQNVLIYGLPTPIQERGLLDPIWGQGNQIYRVGYDGQQMNLLENIAETTGIGLGVHTVIYPDATGFAAADGQKDVVAFFSRATGNAKTRVQAAFRFDWIGKDQDSGLEANWFGGGRVRITRLLPAAETGLYDYRGIKGNKIDWEMVPMGEFLVYSGQLPGNAVRSLTGADNCVHHPTHPLSLVTLRMFGIGIVFDRRTQEPICAISSPAGTADTALPIRKLPGDPPSWELVLDNVVTSGHECGFGPNGRWFVMTNNTKQNSLGVFDCHDPDPRKWRRITDYRHPAWTGSSPSPFHIAYSMDGSKMFLSELHQKPAKSGIVVVDTNTWRTIKRFENVGVDCQTLHPTYDGKYVLQIFSGFQRMESGTFVFTQDTLEPVGYLPNFGGHHDCVIPPRNNQELIHSRSTTV